jgi:hypothetical protein
VGAQSLQGCPGVLAAALARAESWLLEPGAEAGGHVARGPSEPAERPVTAVIGLAPRCGATTVARGLAAELAARDPIGAAVVTSAGAAPGPALRTSAAGRLGRMLAAQMIEPLRTSGRICLIGRDDGQSAAARARTIAPVVLDASHGTPAHAVAGLSDRLVIVGSPEVEPALLELVPSVMRSAVPGVVVVLNRWRPGDEGPAAPADLLLPEARLAAPLALAGREPPGPLGSALAELADRLDRLHC